MGALPRVRRRAGDDAASRATRQASLLAGVLAAELPDLDVWLARGDEVAVSLQAHRGLSHALAFSPVVALGAALLARLVFRQARFAPLLAPALLSVLFAHLLPDVWTGWGTRLLLPFSDARLSLDWTGVVDPWVTLPLVVGVGAAWKRRRGGVEVWRRALLAGLCVSALYVATRAGAAAHLTGRVQAAFPGALAARAFPTPLSLVTWRWAALLPGGGVAAGEVRLLGPLVEQVRSERSGVEALPPDVARVPAVREALAWARFPRVTLTPVEGGREVRVADLRYHLGGAPTLSFVVVLDAEGAVVSTRLERGGSASELLRRWRGK